MCPFVLAVFFIAGARSCALAPVAWEGVHAKGLFIAIAPKAFPDKATVPLQDVTVDSRLGAMPTKIAPRFAINCDRRISLDATGWCVEASGAKSGDAVRVEHCNGGRSQRWNWLPGGAMQLEGTSQCLRVMPNQNDLQGALLELRHCGTGATASWTLDEPFPSVPHTLVQHLPSVFASRNAKLNFISAVALIFVVRVSAWLRQWQQRSLNVVSLGAVDTDRGGVCLVPPMTTDQGKLLLSEKRDLIEQRSAHEAVQQPHSFESKCAKVPEKNAATQGPDVIVPKCVDASDDSATYGVSNAEADVPATSHGLARRAVIKNSTILLLSLPGLNSLNVISHIIRGDFPPAEYKAVAKEIYIEAQPGNDAIRVLEIGAGSCNSVFEDRFRAGCDVTAIDKQGQPVKLGKAQSYATEHGYQFSFEQGDATQLTRFADSTFDAVVCSLVLCSVSSVEDAASEVFRVLKPGGRFGFIEHVRVVDEDKNPLLAATQIVLDPAQQLLADNCHLRRDTGKIILETFGGEQSVIRLQRMTNDMGPCSQQIAGVVIKT